MFASPAFAQAAAAPGAAGPAGGLAMFGQFVPLVAIFVIFYFLMIRPQQRRMKAHKAMLDAVKQGDEVVTGGGIVGKVTRIKDDELEVEVAPTVKLRVVRGTLSDVRSKTLPAAANDGKR